MSWELRCLSWIATQREIIFPLIVWWHVKYLGMCSNDLLLLSKFIYLFICFFIFTLRQTWQMTKSFQKCEMFQEKPGFKRGRFRILKLVVRFFQFRLKLKLKSSSMVWIYFYLGYIFFRSRFSYFVAGIYSNSREGSGNYSYVHFLELIWNKFGTPLCSIWLPQNSSMCDIT